MSKLYAKVFLVSMSRNLGSIHPYLVQTLSKWSSKIQAVAPSVLLPSNRATFLEGSQQLKSAVQLIDETLADHEKLLARTHISREKKGRIGVPHEENADVPDAADPDIFDDTDFYQKCLETSLIPVKIVTEARIGQYHKGKRKQRRR